jgi:hypothetical protein
MTYFVVVGLKWDSGADELWEIWLDRKEPKVEAGPFDLAGYGAEREIIEVYGKKLGEKIWKAYEYDDIEPIRGKQALKILKAIDDYMEEEYGIETNLLDRADDLFIYKLKV